MDKIESRIRNYRMRSHLTQAQVASALGMNRSTYARHEKDGDFTYEMILALARLFHVPSEWIFYGEDKPHNDLFRPVIAPDTPIERLESTTPNFTIEETFDVTNDEKNMLRIFRRLKPDDKKFIKEFLEQRQ